MGSQLSDNQVSDDQVRNNRLSICIPTYNEASTISTLLQQLKVLDCEIIIADGGSQDDTVNLAKAFSVTVLQGAKGRAAQMALAAAHASGDVLWFVHADSRFESNLSRQIQPLLNLSPIQWGRFDVRLDAQGMMFRIIETMINWRSKVTQVATGDQGIFVHRLLYQQLGGFAPIALMEDVELCKRLRKVSPIVCISSPIITSARRWQQKGIWRTILLMWFLRAAYFIGINPSRLVRWYR